MFSATGWRIRTWNAETVGGKLLIGIGAGVAEIGLWDGSQAHTLSCAGVSGGLGYGVSLRDVSLPGGLMGFCSDSRTQGGTLYKNELVIRGDLTFEDLRSSWVVVQGAELSVMDSGAAGYLVLFASSTGSFAPLLAGGGLLTGAAMLAACRALTFLSVGQAGLPNVGVVGYRYRVIGAS